MIDKKGLELQIEEVREKMYEAYQSPNNYTEVLRISQELDDLLNKLNGEE
ncbi:aspartyl-phosphate phosphatase Spo0E family protein [Halobacillus sp. BBL2006]|nr:aspartyl-phosphate phosphatase Spo0E family protein [Halobacillus sp. BBL2006]